MRVLGILWRVLGTATCVLGMRLLAAESARPAEAAAPAGVVLNVRDFGATGDGQAHSVRTWITSRRFSSWRQLQREYPFVTDERWSTDEAAFERAKRALPPEGGTIHFPPGHYIATAGPWSILRDGVQLRGEDAATTVLSTGPDVAEGLVLAGYRHVGWSRSYPFDPREGGAGSTTLTLAEPTATERFAPGALVFIRNGANRYDQDYGEFNEVAQVDDQGRVHLRYPLARDYTLDALNWAGKLAEDFRVPRPRRSARAVFSQEPGCVLPSRGQAITVGGVTLQVEDIQPDGRARLVNPGYDPRAADTVLPAQSLVAKDRGLILLEKSTRAFRAENLTIRGRRKALNLSNSYDSRFVDCIIERRPEGARVSGGLTIDGDGGRFAQFLRCTITADPPWGMQFARSFGSVSFVECRFLQANASFTEFNFDCEVVRSVFEVGGTPDLHNVVIVGKSCDDLRVIGNRITARALPAVFDTHMDIQSYKRTGTKPIVVRDNRITTTQVPRLFAIGQMSRVQATDNVVESSP